MKQHLLLFALMAILSSCTPQSPDLTKLSPEQWREDIQYFMEQAPKTHVNLYNSMPKNRFDSIGNDLIGRVANLGADQITAEMVRWVAALGDGHTNLMPPNTHTFPVLPFWFQDGFFIDNAQKEGKPWIGWKLLKINDIEVETIADQLRPYQQHDNEQQIKAQAPGYLVNVEALMAIGVVKGVEKAKFLFKNTQTGEIKIAELSPIPQDDLYANRHGGVGHESNPNWPLYRRNRDQMYWFEWLPTSKTLYFQYNVTQENQHESVADFIKKMAKAVEDNPVERFVVDLRWNGGGNLFTSKPFTQFIVNNPKINQRGKLFVILGRHTFSAASYFTSSMEFQTNAIFVGEPTGASPNHYGDTRAIRLPNSGLEPRLSTIYWQNSFPWDKRPATQPDILVPPTSADWLANRDAALEAVMGYPKQVEPLAVPETLKKSLSGRYLFDKEKVADIHEQGGQLHLSIEGFVETNLYQSPSGGKLGSGVRSLYIVPAAKDQIMLEAVGGSVVLERLPSGFMLPKELLAAGKIPEALAAYRKVKQENPSAFSTSEVELNRIGYEMMNTKQMETAQSIFELNTEFYPDGFNTWDSLAEYFMNTGDKTKAIAYYKKSIALNPNNENGKRALKKLE